jgi:hypothetical protein
MRGANAREIDVGHQIELALRIFETPQKPRGGIFEQGRLVKACLQISGETESCAPEPWKLEVPDLLTFDRLPW